MDLIKMRENRATLVNQAREVWNRADAEKRSLSGEESAKYDQIMADVDKMGEEVARLERLEAIEAKLASPVGNPMIGDPAPGKADADAQYKAFGRFLKNGTKAMTGADFKALQADDDAAGGYLMAPQTFVRELIKAVDNMLFMRQIARVIPVTSGDSLGAPELTADPDDADWTGEITSVSADAAMTFGKRELAPKLLTKLVKISRKLLRTSAIPVEALVQERLAYKFAVSQEKGFLTGNGSGQPLGVFTASAQGISTGRDVSTSNSTTEIKADNLFNNFYNLKMQYQRNASWLFHRDAVKQVRKLKDGDGQYLWQPGLTAGEPDALLGRPVYMSEYAPNTFTTSLYVGLVGDFRAGYWIADSVSLGVQRLDELYAANNQVGYIGRAEVDGAPVLEEAFSRIQLG